MGPEVFISHSSQDREAADAICAILERNGVSCWLAHRDILGSAEWAASIANALQQARIVLLIVSTNTNSSREIPREIHIADETKKPILPVGIEDAELTGALKYYVQNKHRLNAYPGTIDSYERPVVDTVRRLLGEAQPEALPPESKRRAFPVAFRQAALWMGSATLLILLVAGLLTWRKPPQPDTGHPATGVTQPTA